MRDRAPHTPSSLRCAALLLVGACFTGDGLRGQPCQTDMDCNPLADLHGEALRCVHNICGYMAACGDGIDDDDEACDDGNRIDGDGCSKSCTREVCGDGVLQPQEACDDGNLLGGDGCSEFCAHEVCGDGVLQPQEACDDGNRVDTDACLNTCAAARCGDGVVRSGVEVCDDGNLLDEDPCLATCEPNVCGDGSVDATREGCDDQNADDDDGCNNECRMGAEALGLGPTAYHVCAIRRGALRCWGAGKSGQLGNGGLANLGDEPGELPALLEVPASVPPERVVKVTTGAFATCALLDRGAVRCWGSNSTLLGTGPPILGTGESKENIGDDPGELPAVEAAIVDPIQDAGVEVLDVRLGYIHACALLSTGGVRCWGANEYGMLGYPASTKPSDKTPVDNGDVELGGKATQIGVGSLHTCALLDDQTVRCWGWNAYGQLGYPGKADVGDTESPEDAGPVDVGGLVQQIDVGRLHTCAVLVGGAEVRCWGYGMYGQLGTQSAADVGQSAPPSEAGTVKMLAPGDRVTKLVLGGYHTCVLLETAEVRCWGAGGEGQLGYESVDDLGDDPNDASPAAVDVGGPVRDLVAGEHHTCALLDGGRVRCWGDNLAGQLGRNKTDDVGHAPGTMPPENSLIYPNPQP